MARRLLAALPLLPVGVWGCGGDAAGESSRFGGGSAWTVSAEPSLVIQVGGLHELGEAEGPGYVTWATRLRDGGIVVADHHGPGIHRFDGEGRLLGSYSRPGNGPGEMRSARWISDCGTDELILWDYTRRMFLYFDHDLSYLGESRPQEEPDAIRCLGPGGSGEGDEKARILVLGFPHVFPPQGDSGERGTADLWVTDFRGRRVATLGVVPHHENRAMARRTLISGAGDRYFLGLSEDPSIRVHPLVGPEEAPGTVKVFQVEAERRAPTPAEYEASIQIRADFMSAEQGRIVMHERLSAIPAPRTIPPYNAMAASPEGTLWVVTSTHGAPVTELQGLDARGEIRGRVSLPWPFELFEAGEEWILGVRPGEDGSLEVVLLEVDR